MKNRKLIIALALLFILMGTIWGTASAKKSPITEEEVIWEISKPEIIDAGETIVMGQGTLVQGFVVQAKAKSRHNNVVPEGTIVMILSAFQPNQDLPGQVAGVWYVQGEWEITKKNALPESANARHSSDKAHGSVKAELAFNPLSEPQSWSGLAWIPMSPAAGRWSKGKGSITLNGQFEGELMLDLSRLPEIQ